MAKLAFREATSSLFGDLFKDLGKSIFGGGGAGGTGFANGGRPPLNQVSVVGERGPELFVPDTAGTIIPNHQMGGGGMTIFADMRGASVEAVQRLEVLVAKVSGSIEPRAIDAVVSEKQRNPALFSGAT